MVFISDNGSSEPIEMKNLATVGVEQANKFFRSFNNTAANVGNATPMVNYGAWGAGAAISPFSYSYFKTTQGEGARSPLVMKLPVSNANL